MPRSQSSIAAVLSHHTAHASWAGAAMLVERSRHEPQARARHEAAYPQSAQLVRRPAPAVSHRRRTHENRSGVPPGQSGDDHVSEGGAMTSKAVRREQPLDAQDNDSTAGRSSVRAEESHVGFRVRKLGLYFVKGRFRRVQGHVEFDSAGVPIGGEIVIDAASIFTRIPPRDWHLRTNDFLGVRRHPHIRVTAVEVSPMAEGDLRVRARFAIRDKEEDIILRAHLHQGDTPGRKILHLQGRIDRHDFGVRARTPVEWVVGREVELDVKLSLERSNAASRP
jgi:polyisoprenoid-binding protein YceI